MRRNKKSYLLALAIGLGLACAASADVKVGETFPDLAPFKLEGKLPDTFKGKVVLVDFWASWCGPCAQSFPVMDELQKKYAAQGLVILAVNVDEKKGDMERFMKERQVSFTIVRDAGQKLVAKTGISAMPSSFLIDQQGKVIYTHTGFHGSATKKQYEREIESLLKNNAK